METLSADNAFCIFGEGLVQNAWNWKLFCNGKNINGLWECGKVKCKKFWDDFRRVIDWPKQSDVCNMNVRILFEFFSFSFVRAFIHLFAQFIRSANHKLKFSAFPYNVLFNFIPELNKIRETSTLGLCHVAFQVNYWKGGKSCLLFMNISTLLRPFLIVLAEFLENMTNASNFILQDTLYTCTVKPVLKPPSNNDRELYMYVKLYVNKGQNLFSF
jgi:hypothetical protein